MPSGHLILCHPLFLLPSIPHSIRVFSNESTHRMRWPKYWSFSFSIIPSKEHQGLISFRMDWLDLLEWTQYGLEKAECQRIDAFELWCWRRLLRVPWTAKRSTQSILKEISPGCSSEGLMLKLKLQYFGHLIQRVDSLEKTLMPGGIGDRRRRG